MRILYLAHQYDYGRPEQGFCFEHYNFYLSLVAMGHEVDYFDYPTLVHRHGPEAMNAMLRRRVADTEPHLLFAVVWGDPWLSPDTVREITEQTRTLTLNWYCDDHWRFETLSRRWTPCFDWVVTTSSATLHRYAECGFDNVIASQWAANTDLYGPARFDDGPGSGWHQDPAPRTHGITFVGLPHGHRANTIASLRRAGLPVETFGKGWPNGRIEQDAMIALFSGSRINLNFSEASTLAGRPGIAARLCDALGPRLRDAPALWRLEQPMRDRLDPTRRLGPHMTRQIKGRVFEVPACGGFLLTGGAEDLDRYYASGREIVTFDTLDELIDKARYYLDHEAEREAIARAGYRRTLTEHTYKHRFTEIFSRMGLPASSWQGSAPACAA